jgi:hypothetical protein
VSSRSGGKVGESKHHCAACANAQTLANSGITSAVHHKRAGSIGLRPTAQQNAQNGGIGVAMTPGVAAQMSPGFAPAYQRGQQGPFADYRLPAMRMDRCHSNHQQWLLPASPIRRSRASLSDALPHYGEDQTWSRSRRWAGPVRTNSIARELAARKRLFRMWMPKMACVEARIWSTAIHICPCASVGYVDRFADILLNSLEKIYRGRFRPLLTETPVRVRQ